MNKYFLSLLLVLFAATGIFAEQTFLIKDASKAFDVKIKIDSCEEELCNDKAIVYLMKKNQADAFQTFEMPEMYLRLETEKKLDGSLIEMSKEEIYGVYFVDYNFDGAEDLALSNGYYAPYGGISSDVYLFKKATGKFVKHKGLTDLESENMSVDINKKRKYIEAFTKSGCCWHETTRYKFVGNRLVKIYVFTEDATGNDGKVRITTEILVGKRWKKTTRTARIKDYYKD
jgi:hypothetical protein